MIFNSGFLPLVAQQPQTLEFNLSTRLMSSESATAPPVLLPDWQRIFFGTMPPIQESGADTTDVRLDDCDRYFGLQHTGTGWMALEMDLPFSCIFPNQSIKRMSHNSSIDYLMRHR